RGFYTYGEGSGKKKNPNSDIYRFFGGEERTEPDSISVQHRMALVMINEAAWCLQEEILQNPTDGDLGAVLGLGFPPFLGGPFRYIDRMGAGEIVDRLERFEQELGPRFTPARILRDHASGGKTFYD